ncbi:MAG: GntR family transcriptional regulator [Streptosporangiales bacterium]|nr:GntR family transcriptional regulator [Streptosporangiales bacterium]
MRPGAKVATQPLSERLGLSATPLKAALAVLEQEGFLTAVPHRGYFVSEVTARDMREIYELREVIDGIAGRSAAGQQEHEFAARLRDLLAEHEAVATAGDLVACPAG